MKISMDKKYKTREGRAVRVLCINRKHSEYPVVTLFTDSSGAEYFDSYTEDGIWDVDIESCSRDLIEVSSYDDFKIDDPVMVKDGDCDRWYKRYFAGVDGNGLPTVFFHGCTSWSGKRTDVIDYDHCRRPTKEELDG